MSKYVISSFEDGTYEPYKPVNNIDFKTGRPLTDPEELRQKRGPFFSCNGAIHEPHFHAVDRHPIMDNDIKGRKIKYEQLHVPGYDEHDGHSLGVGGEPFHIITGWNVSIPTEKGEDAHHFYQFASTKKYPESIDNEEAHADWEDHMQSLFGSGKFEEHPLSIGDHTGAFAPTHSFHPAAITGNPSSYSCTFFPRIEHDGVLSPAMSTTNFGDDTSSSEEAKSKIIDYANATKEHAQKNLEKKVSEDPSYWENLYKQSKRIYTLGEQGKILDMQDYNPGMLHHAMKCECKECTTWSGIDFKNW